MVTAKQVPIWGHLQPLLPHPVNEIDKQTYELALPGSFGRESLIRPFLDTCPCRKRPYNSDKDSPKKSRCNNCNSVRSLATFIPRKNLLHFSYPLDDTSDGLVIEISGNNAMQIVHLHYNKESLQSNNVSCQDHKLTIVRDGDEIFLQYEGLGLASASSSANSEAGDAAGLSLIRFRVAQATTQHHTEHEVRKNTLESVDVTQNNAKERQSSNEAEAPTRDPCTSEKVDAVKNDVTVEKTLGLSQNDGGNNASSQINVDKTMNQVANGVAMSSLDPNTGKIDECRQDKDKTFDQTTESKGKSQDSEMDKCEQCSGTEGESVQEDSAPLTLPMNFVAANSRSFSYEYSQNSLPSDEQNSQNKSEYAPRSSQTTPQKSNLTAKRKHTNTRTSLANDLIEEETNEVSVPISSLTYNQLRQLHKESNEIHNTQQSSVRTAVLSLTLALTSDASAWDAAFLKGCGERGSKNEDANVTRQTGKWMPRLLQGTNILVPKDDVDSSMP
jgi:hypothetical protein